MPKTNPLTEDQRVSILDMFHEGATRRDIALAHGVSVAVVSKIVKEAGYQFPGNNGTQAATLAAQLDLADWHERKAGELYDQESEMLKRANARVQKRSTRRSGGPQTQLKEIREAAAITDEILRLHDEARRHMESAERMRHAVRLREMPDEDWPHTLAMAWQRGNHGSMSKAEAEAITTEFRRRKSSLHPMIHESIKYELWKLREGQ